MSMLDPTKIKKLIDSRDYWYRQEKQIALMRGSVTIRDDAVYPNHLHLNADTDLGNAIKDFCSSYVTKKILEVTQELNRMGIK